MRSCFARCSTSPPRASSPEGRLPAVLLPAQAVAWSSAGALPLTDAAYALSNWHHLPSPYGPLFTLLSEPLALLPLTTSFFVWRVVVACSLASLALVGWLAHRMRRSPHRALACAGLCPATLVYGIGGFHNDLPAVVCVLGAVAAVVPPTSARARAGRGWPGTPRRVRSR